MVVLNKQTSLYRAPAFFGDSSMVFLFNHQPGGQGVMETKDVYKDLEVPEALAISLLKNDLNLGKQWETSKL